MVFSGDSVFSARGKNRGFGRGILKGGWCGQLYPGVSVMSETWFLAPIKLVPVCYNNVNYPELDAIVGIHVLTRASSSFKMVFFE